MKNFIIISRTDPIPAFPGEGEESGIKINGTGFSTTVKSF